MWGTKLCSCRMSNPLTSREAKGRLLRWKLPLFRWWEPISKLLNWLVYFGWCSCPPVGMSLCLYPWTVICFSTYFIFFYFNPLGIYEYTLQQVPSRCQRDCSQPSCDELNLFILHLRLPAELHRLQKAWQPQIQTLSKVHRFYSNGCEKEDSNATVN